MAEKIAVPNPRAPDYSHIFNWGLKLRAFQELFLLAGLGAHRPDRAILHPDDPVAQTRIILADLDAYLKDSGYGRDDIIRVEFTLTKQVKNEQIREILGLFAEFFAPVAVKPAAGTLRIVEALAIEGMLVEYEFWAAK